MRPALRVSRGVRCVALSLLAPWLVGGALLAGCGKKETPTTSAPDAAAQPGAAGQPAVAGPLAVAGRWRITSATDPSGKSFSGGTVDIRQSGAAWELTWNLPSGTVQKGVGLDIGGGVLAAGWGGTRAFGVVVYDVAGGTLTGTWVQTGVVGVGSEVLSGPAGLSGTYAITSAKTPVGGSYGGSVTITPSGELHDMSWLTGTQAQRGVAKLEGTKLIAGWGADVGAGFVRYRLTAPNRLEGIWAPVGGSKTSIEILER